MAAPKSNLTKRIQIDKANALMVTVAAISSFIVVFSLVASSSLLSQRAYQSRVISKKEQARNQLKQNISTTKALVNSYTAFISTSQNIIGGNSVGTGNRDGDNAHIVLDALPSAYDFPAVTSSLEKILSQNGLSIASINGTDDEIAQQKNSTSAQPQPIPIPFQITVTGSYAAAQSAFGAIEASIRPINISQITLSGDDSNLSVNIQAQTYYQPATSLNISSVVVK